ncbi:MAG: AAA family ATPase [Gemmataceae bacterium]|nr:AAA family ATPase [Gemmataceae bacterium]
MASRLAGQVEPGSVLVTAAALRLVGGEFETAPAGSVRLRGAAGPVELYRVVRDTGRPNRVELTDPGNLSPLVGRDTEVGVLRDRWERAADGTGQVVLLAGDPGLGKSRLIRELREHVAGLHESGITGVVEWRCSAYHRNTGFYPAVEFLERLLRFNRPDGPADRHQRLAEHLAGLGIDAPDHVALLAALLGLSPDPRFPLPQLSPQRQRERTVDLLLGWLAAYAAGRPLLFVAEDLHWADPSTVELLARFVGESAGQAVLAVFTFRPEFRPPWPDPAHQTRIGLSKLTRRQIGELMARRLGRADVPAAIVEQVAARTDGVPLFVEEFATLVRETGLLDRPSDGESVELRVIPATLQDLLLARLDRLGSDPAVVQLAAAVGREFDHELMAAASDLPAPALTAELDKLVAAEVLFRKGRPPRCGYIFKHALIQDAAYGAILRGRRQEHHRRIAGVLERDFPATAETKPELLAHHWTAAGDVPQALHYWRAAGTQAQDRSAHVEAVRHLSRGLELVAGLPDGGERDGAELGLRVPLATSYLALRGYAAPEVEEQTVRARELCERLGPDAPLFPVMMTLWALRFIQGRNRLAADLSREVVALAAGRDDGHKAEAEWASGCTAWWAGRFADALAHAERGLRLWRHEASLGHARFTGQNSGPLLTAYTGLALWALGRGREGRDRLAASAALAEGLKHPFTLVATVFQQAHAGLLAGDWGSAAVAADRVLAVSDENGFAFYAGLARSLKGAALLLAGRPAEAVPLLEDGIARVEATGCEMVHQTTLAHLADALWACGRRDEARAALDRALALTTRDAERYVEAELLRRQALFLLDDGGDPAEVGRLLTQAREVAAAQGAKYFELRAAVALGRVRPAEARPLVAALVDGFAEADNSPDLAEARRFLVATGG